MRKLDRPFATVGAGENGLARIALGASARDRRRRPARRRRGEVVRRSVGARRGHSQAQRRGAVLVAARRVALLGARHGVPQSLERERSDPTARGGRRARSAASAISTPPTAERHSATASRARGIASARARRRRCSCSASTPTSASSRTSRTSSTTRTRATSSTSASSAWSSARTPRMRSSCRRSASSTRVTVGLQSRADFLVARRAVSHGASRATRDRAAGRRHGDWHGCLRRGAVALAAVVPHDVRHSRRRVHVRRHERPRRRTPDAQTAAIVSPKASLVFVPSRNTELYLSGGLGFHSNDARGTTITVDPAPAIRRSRVDPLVRSRGAEIGLRANPAARLAIDARAVGARPRQRAAVHRRRWRDRAVGQQPPERGDVRELLSAGAAALARRRRVVRARAIRRRRSGAGPHSGRARERRRRWRHLGAERRTVRSARSACGTSAPTRSSRTTAFARQPPPCLNADAGFFVSGARLQLSVLNLLNQRANDIQYYYSSRLPGRIGRRNGRRALPSRGAEAAPDFVRLGAVGRSFSRGGDR